MKNESPGLTDAERAALWRDTYDDASAVGAGPAEAVFYADEAAASGRRRTWWFLRLLYWLLDLKEKVTWRMRRRC